MWNDYMTVPYKRLKINMMTRKIRNHYMVIHVDSHKLKIILSSRREEL